MAKKDIEIIITSALVVVFILAMGNAIKVVRQKAKAKPPALIKALPPSLPRQESTPIKKREKESLEWRRCPFSGKVYSAQGQAFDLKLSGILWDEENPQAIINEKIVKQGDLIENRLLVVKINNDCVILSDGEKELKLRLGR